MCENFPDTGYRTAEVPDGDPSQGMLLAWAYMPGWATTKVESGLLGSKAACEPKTGRRNDRKLRRLGWSVATCGNAGYSGGVLAA